MRDKIVRNEVVRLSADLVTVLGPNLELHDCTVESFADNRGVVIAGVVMSGGVFDQHVRMANFHFEKIRFNNVQFKGEYVGCDFGDWDDVKVPRISDCDFSAATLHECRFLNCDMTRVTTPKWPCFRMINPAEARDFVKSKSWPKGIGLMLDIYTDTDPECVALAANAAAMAEDSKVPLDQLRVMLEGIPGVEIED